jgi:molybdenum cofactor cytidylyltransferase
MLTRNMNQEVLANATALPSVLILAAGRGERFRASGGDTHKLQAMLGDRTVLQTTIAAVQASGLPWHVEYGPHPGMGESIAAAVSATSRANGWLILPADLPLVQTRTLQTLAAQLGQLDADLLQVIQPFYHAQKGHPVAFTRAALRSLLALHGDQGASCVVKAAAQSQALKRWDCDDLGCVLDVDTVSALEQARQLLRQRLQDI